MLKLSYIYISIIIIYTCTTKLLHTKNKNKTSASSPWTFRSTPVNSKGPQRCARAFHPCCRGSSCCWWASLAQKLAKIDILKYLESRKVWIIDTWDSLFYMCCSCMFRKLCIYIYIYDIYITHEDKDEHLKWIQETQPPVVQTRHEHITVYKYIWTTGGWYVYVQLKDPIKQ